MQLSHMSNPKQVLQAHSLHFIHCNESSLVPLPHLAKQTQQTFWFYSFGNKVSPRQRYLTPSASQSRLIRLPTKLALDVDGIGFIFSEELDLESLIFGSFKLLRKKRSQSLTGSLCAACKHFGSNIFFNDPLK